MPIAEIVIADRHRKDMGDLDGLAASIAAIGLLHPVVVRTDGRLIAGGRRIEAFKPLGRAEIPAIVIDIESIARGEHDENLCRKDFTPSEAVAIAREIEDEEKAAAKKRQGTRTDLHPGKLPKGSEGRAGDKIAKATGKERRTLEKAKAVVEAAEADPERFDGIVADMDESGNVDRAFKQVQIAKERADYERRADKGARIGDLLTMAEKGEKFSVIYADLLWAFEVYSGKGKQRSAERYYDTSSLEAIKALPVSQLAADGCALFLWGVCPELPGALAVIEAWGFEYKTFGFLWVKQNPGGKGLFTGMGYWTRANPEFCLLATRGSPRRLAMDVHQIIVAPVGEHSSKPGEARARIERLLAGPYLELFARGTAGGWTAWGRASNRNSNSQKTRLETQKGPAANPGL